MSHTILLQRDLKFVKHLFALTAVTQNKSDKVMHIFKFILQPSFMNVWFFTL